VAVQLTASPLLLLALEELSESEAKKDNQLFNFA
jgi:hypothetical protein